MARRPPPPQRPTRLAQRVTPDTGWDAGAGTGHASPLGRGVRAWPSRTARGSYRPCGALRAHQLAQQGREEGKEGAERASAPEHPPTGSGARPEVGPAWSPAWLSSGGEVPGVTCPCRVAATVCHWQGVPGTHQLVAVHVGPPYVCGRRGTQLRTSHPNTPLGGAPLRVWATGIGAARPPPPPPTPLTVGRHAWCAPADTAFQSGLPPPPGPIPLVHPAAGGPHLRSGGGQGVQRRRPPPPRPSSKRTGAG